MIEKYFKNIIKGFIIGIGKIIPGVSGSAIAISLGVYEKILSALANLRHITLNKFFFLTSILLGALISISLFSYPVKWLLDNFYFVIILLFTGLIIGGMPDMYNNVKYKKTNTINIIIFIISLIISYTLTSIGHLPITTKENALTYFILGLIEAFSSIVPGISGTAIYMSLGVYDILLDFFGHLFSPTHIKFSLFFGAGVILGTIIIAKIITYLLNNHKIKTYFSIMGFMTSSIILMIKSAFENIPNQTICIHIIVGIIFLYFGYKITVKINTLLSNN